MTAMKILIDLLEKANVPFELTDDVMGNVDNQVWYPSKEKSICDVICHEYSYGGEIGLLEIMGLLTSKEKEKDDVVGYLTAEDVFDRIWGDYCERQNKSK